MRLLFLNSLKGIKNNKLQMVVIVFMIMLSTAIYVGMNIAINRLEDRYYNYLDEQNVEDISFEVYYDYETDININNFEYIQKNYLLTLSETENEVVDLYTYYLHNNMTIDSNTLYKGNLIFSKYNVDSYLQSEKLELLKDKYNFDYELKLSKIISMNDVTISVMPYEENSKINIPYLVEGRFPNKDNEITMLPYYAKIKNLDIGDMYRIGNVDYEIVGYTYASDYIYPLVSSSMPVFDEEANNVIFMTKRAYEKINGVLEKNFAFRFKENPERKFQITNHESHLYNQIQTNEAGTLGIGINTDTRMGRIGTLQLEFDSNRLLAQYFLYLLLGISVVITIVIIKKRIDDERLQIGILKSLGYRRFSIATSYLVYPVLGSLIGGILGYIIGIFIQTPLAESYRSYYTVPLNDFVIPLKYLKNTLLVPMLLLSLLSYLISLFILRKKPLQLLKEGSNLSVNMFSRIFNKLISFLPFTYRFRYSLAFRSFGKLFIVSFTSFCTGLLIVLVLIGSNLFSNLIDSSFLGIKYKYAVIFNQPGFMDFEDKDKYIVEDYLFITELPIEKIVDKNKNVKEIEKALKINLTAVDEQMNYFKIINTESNEVISLLGPNKIIVNENMKEQLNLEIGDSFYFTVNGVEIHYEIIGFNSEYYGSSGYVNRKDFSNKLNLEKAIYNQIASNDDKYADINNLNKEEIENINMILDMKKLRTNIEKQMTRFSGSVYMVIIFAAVIAIIIIAVIANIVVEKNKKVISLMKVMGYKNKYIEKTVLNIYTPFVIGSYLLSIPVMISLLKMIVNNMVEDIDMVIPVSLSLGKAMLGLLGLLIAYYIAIGLSKRILKKTPLGIALKRE